MAAQKSTITEKLAKIASEVGTLSKDKEIQGGAKYRYLSDEKVMDIVTPLLARERVVFIPTAIEHQTLQREVTRRSGVVTEMFTEAKVKFRFYDADTGEFLEGETLGCGSDSGDKSSNKALTGARKYAYRLVFGIRTGDDPDDVESPEPTIKPKHWTELPSGQEVLKEFGEWLATITAERDQKLAAYNNVKCAGNIQQAHDIMDAEKKRLQEQ